MKNNTICYHRNKGKLENQPTVLQTDMWQSHVEIKDPSVAYFNRIAVFKVSYCWTFVKGGAHTRFVDSIDIRGSTRYIWAPPLMKVQQYGTSNTAKQSKRDGIIFNFTRDCHICNSDIDSSKLVQHRNLLYSLFRNLFICFRVTLCSTSTWAILFSGFEGQ